ncbi:uncharacterized protein LOC122174080 isoform X3 [Chrysemys picta bellii]|uniref:uncharacterized protein LOC122174080 isoform X3 n=1 Tax=Chrysemys picta bellii TaxID=8478 RepID=UPI0032B2C562
MIPLRMNVWSVECTFLWGQCSPWHGLFGCNYPRRILHPSRQGAAAVRLETPTLSSLISMPATRASKWEPSSTLAVVRRSRRVRKKRNFSPEVEIVAKGRKVSRGDRAAGRGRTRRVKGAAGLDSGKGCGFCCDLCSSPYLVDPSRRGNQLKTSSSLPSPRHKRDPRTGQVLTLCNACGLALTRPRSTPNPAKDPGPDERKRHEEQLQAFGRAMVELLGDQDGSKLCCPAYTRKPCLCLQNYLKAPGLGESESRTRALEFLRLLQESKRLKAVKFCSAGDSQQAGEPRRRQAFGLVSGQRRSRAFEDFVLKNRRVLREELKLCERATQRILGYSNNFLHKKLKTSSQMAHTYGRLLQHWRDQALMGQSEARRVLAEMLTPSGGCRCNCYRFISWVTGSSPSTISKVNEQMKRTGGDREPPPHRLKQWRKENPKPNKKGCVAEERAQSSQAPLLASPSAAGSQELPSVSVHGPASAGKLPASVTGALDPCLLPQAMIVSSIVSALPSTGGEMTSPCTRRPAGTFSPAPAAASASLAPSSPLLHRAQGVRPTEQQHLRGLGYTRDPAHPAQPSTLVQSPALSQLLGPDSGLRPARQQMQGAEEIRKGQELQPPLILMGANKGAVPGSINSGGRFLGGCVAGAVRGPLPSAEQRLPSQLAGGDET